MISIYIGIARGMQIPNNWLTFLDDVDHLVDLYDSLFRDIGDEHVPLRTKEISRRLMLPMYNKNIQADT